VTPAARRHDVAAGEAAVVERRCDERPLAAGVGQPQQIVAAAGRLNDT